MQFIVNARIPILDELLTGENQSFLIEALFWTMAFLIYANLFSSLLRSISEHLPWWHLAKKRGGVLCGNGQDDSLLYLVLAVHHGVAGAMMMLGVLFDDPILWRHGYLLESGYEIADLFSIFFNLYPYRQDGMKPEIKIALIFHHLPGILLSAFVLEADLHYNTHLREIGMWLLLGACQSCVGGVFIYCLNFDTQMKQAAVLYLLNVAVFVWCRLVVFPREAYLLIQDVQNSSKFQDSTLLKLLYFGGISLSLFNLGIVADVVPKSIRYCKRAIDGVTPIETEPIPKSREDRMNERR